MTRWGDWDGYKASNPTVSPDGKWFAFQSARSTDRGGRGLRDLPVPAALTRRACGRRTRGTAHANDDPMTIATRARFSRRDHSRSPRRRRSRRLRGAHRAACRRRARRIGADPPRLRPPVRRPRTPRHRRRRGRDDDERIGQRSTRRRAARHPRALPPRVRGRDRPRHARRDAALARHRRPLRGHVRRRVCAQGRSARLGRRPARLHGLLPRALRRREAEPAPGDARRDPRRRRRRVRRALLGRARGRRARAAGRAALVRRARPPPPRPGRDRRRVRRTQRASRAADPARDRPRRRGRPRPRAGRRPRRRHRAAAARARVDLLAPARRGRRRHARRGRAAARRAMRRATTGAARLPVWSDTLRPWITDGDVESRDEALRLYAEARAARDARGDTDHPELWWRLDRALETITAARPWSAFPPLDHDVESGVSVSSFNPGGGGAVGVPGQSPELRLAIQATLAVALAVVAGRAISGARWYWAVLAAYVVFIRATTVGETFSRAWQRMLGTLVGVAIGLLVATLVGHHAWPAARRRLRRDLPRVLPHAHLVHRDDRLLHRRARAVVRGDGPRRRRGSWRSDSPRPSPVRRSACSCPRSCSPCAARRACAPSPPACFVRRRRRSSARRCPASHAGERRAAARRDPQRRPRAGGSARRAASVVGPERPRRAHRRDAAGAHLGGARLRDAAAVDGVAVGRRRARRAAARHRRADDGQLPRRGGRAGAGACRRASSRWTRCSRDCSG